MRKDPTEFRKRFAAYKAGKMPYKDGKIVDWEEDTDYGIPFDESKRVRLTDAGYATGAVLSTNMLDSIADNAIKAGLPIRTAMGLAVKESTLGNPTDDRSARTLLSAKTKALWANAGYGLHINEYGDYVSARDLINWWKDLEDARYGKSGRSALEGGFEFYKNNPRKYNPGQPNHPQLVEKRAKELMKSPQIQLWQKNRSQNQVQQLKAKNFNEHWLKRYEDGKSPRKLEYHPEGDYYYGGKVFPGKELVVTGKNRKPHTLAPRTSGMSKNQYKLLTGDLLGAMTTGMNVLSPSLWWGAVRDANGLQDGFNRLMRGNSGFVTENFEREHPYISLGANLIGDAAILGGPSGVKNLNQSVNKSNFYRAYKVSNAINAGVKENPVITAYNRNPIAKEIGSVYDYRLYLDDTFPNSKIKDVLWHGSQKEGLEEFSTKYIGSNAPIKSSTGMYLAPDKYTAKSYGRKGGVYPVLLNTKNPYITDQLFAIKHNGVNVANISPKTRNTILRNNDAVVATKRGEIAFFEPDNALVLGSDKDLNGFKSYVLKSKNISSPTVRTKVGDVEIDNPNINYRVGTKEIVDDFNNTGIVRAGETNALTSHGKVGRFLLKKETFTNPMFKEGSLWYQPSEEMSGLLTTAEPMRIATKSSAPAANDGVFTIQGKTFVNDFNGRRIPLEGLVLDKSNTNSYIWKPEYGYRRVLQLPSTINFNDAKFYDSTAGDESPLNFLFLSDIDRLRKSGINGLTETTPGQESFKLFFGLYPAEYKSHWYSKLNGMPDSYKEKFVERLLNFDLDRAQETLYDIRRANNPAAYSWNNKVLLDGYNMLRNLYTSKAYKSRWPLNEADAVSSELIQNMREVNPVLLKRVIVDNDGGVPMKVHAGGLYLPNKKSIQVLDNGDLTIHTTTHEFSHASDKGKTIDLTGYMKMKPKKSLTQKQFDYYNQDTEKRARIMSLLADMRSRGYNINSYNDIQDYLFFNKAFGNHNANSIFSNYDIKMTDLLDVMRNAKSIVIPTIGVGTVYGTSNK